MFVLVLPNRPVDAVVAGVDWAFEPNPNTFDGVPNVLFACVVGAAPENRFVFEPNAGGFCVVDWLPKTLAVAPKFGAPIELPNVLVWFGAPYDGGAAPLL